MGLVILSLSRGCVQTCCSPEITLGDWEVQLAWAARSMQAFRIFYGAETTENNKVAI